jgi:hypothetical protein
MRKYALLAVGVAVCLTGAILMAFGKGLLGENHTGIATVIGIVGIGLIAGSSKRSSEEAKSSTRGALNG